MALIETLLDPGVSLPKCESGSYIFIFRVPSSFLNRVEGKGKVCPVLKSSP
jgi:hypothetical protein